MLSLKLLYITYIFYMWLSASVKAESKIQCTVNDSNLELIFRGQKDLANVNSGCFLTNSCWHVIRPIHNTGWKIKFSSISLTIISVLLR